jgi:murein DD-endopeptidase MepM/ murein hydrolase activator NlpD
LCPTNKVILAVVGFLLSGCLGPMARGPRPKTDPSVRSIPSSPVVQKKKSISSVSVQPPSLSVVNLSATGYSLPLDHPRIVSSFGSRGRKFHRGIDLVQSARGGDPVRASKAGVVERVAHRGGYGRMVLLRHPDQWFTRYAHLRKVTVRPGQSVQVGETVGFVGESGRATGPHLHFEVLTPSQKTVDPTPYLFPPSPRPPSPEPFSGVPPVPRLSVISPTVDPGVGRP